MLIVESYMIIEVSMINLYFRKW